jgi:hypothetical protein
VFHDSSYNWYWYCFDHGEMSLRFDNVPYTLKDLDNHRNSEYSVEDSKEPRLETAGVLTETQRRAEPA